MGVFDMIDSFLNPQRGYEQAGNQINQGWNQGSQYLQPYNQAGQAQLGQLTGAENSLLNPGQLENQWAQSYQTSPYAQRLLQMNQGQGQEAASAMGLNGSSAALSNIQQGAGDITSRDRQQYMQDLMQKYMTGIGIGQNIYGTGANAGNSLMQGRLSTGENLAGTQYGQQTAPGSMLGKLIGTGINYMQPNLGNAFTGQTNSFNQQMH